MPERLSGPPVPSRQQLLNCVYSHWYPKYKKHIPKSRIIKPLPRAFIDYLLADGLHLPKGGELDWGTNDDYSDGSDWDEANEAEEVADPTLQFPELHQRIEDTIRELKAVAPKLNWSAPKDGTWIATTSDMKCICASDVYMLLKASNYITHDLTEAFDACHDDQQQSTEEEVQYELVLRKWFDVNPSVEFRVFVKDRKIAGITQRDMNYYEFLTPLKDELHDLIDEFFEDTLQTTFDDSSFVFDVYIPRPYERVWLMDINPWADKTDTLLFSWEQLANTDTADRQFDAEFRLVDKSDSSRGFGSVEHTESVVPKDFVDASVSGQGIAEIAAQMREFLSLQRRQDEQDGESD